MPALVGANRGDAQSDEPPVNPRDGNVIRAGLERRGRRTTQPGVGRARRDRETGRRPNGSARGWRRLRSATTRCSDISSKSRTPNGHLVPADYQRRQTLTGAERFVTPALKELERKILTAGSALKELELQIFTKLLRDLQSHAAAILETARAVGEFDATMSLAKVARHRGYVRPKINTGLRIRVRDGRHPVLEAGMRAGEFVPNGLDAEPATRQILLITGPNMAGKSTYLRQVALIAIMAQIGSFVPAAEATIGLID